MIRYLIFVISLTWKSLAATSKGLACYGNAELKLEHVSSLSFSNNQQALGHGTVKTINS
jgi:hypothetical protein